MKISQSIAKKSIALSFGIAMGLLVLSQAMLANVHFQDRQEQSASDEKDEKQQVTPNIAVTSPSVQINLGYQSYLVSDLFSSEETEQTSNIDRWVTPTLKKALKVLFRQIISPNAP